jgi:hypothetical protein
MNLLVCPHRYRRDPQVLCCLGTGMHHSGYFPRTPFQHTDEIAVNVTEVVSIASCAPTAIYVPSANSFFRRPMGRTQFAHSWPLSLVPRSYRARRLISILSLIVFPLLVRVFLCFPGFIFFHENSRSARNKHKVSSGC